MSSNCILTCVKISIIMKWSAQTMLTIRICAGLSFPQLYVWFNEWTTEIWASNTFLLLLIIRHLNLVLHLSSLLRLSFHPVYVGFRSRIDQFRPLGIMWVENMLVMRLLSTSCRFVNTCFVRRPFRYWWPALAYCSSPYYHEAFLTSVECPEAANLLW